MLNQRFTFADFNPLYGIVVAKELVYDEDAIRASLYNLLTTPKGTRAFRPQYGTSTWLFLQEPVDAIAARELEMLVVQDIAVWEPRVDLVRSATRVTANATRDGFNFDLNYRIKAFDRMSAFQFTLRRGTI